MGESRVGMGASLYGSLLSKYPEGFPQGTLIGWQGPIYDPVSGIIRIVTESPWTHVSVCDGMDRIVECTRPGLGEPGPNGVQYAVLSKRLATAERGTSAAAFFSRLPLPKPAAARAFADDCIRMGVKYSIDTLLKFLVGVPQDPTDDRVCSSFAARYLVAGGYMPDSLVYPEVMPGMLLKLVVPLCSSIVPILGNPNVKGMACAA